MVESCQALTTSTTSAAAVIADMSYGLNSGWGRPIGDCIGFSGGSIKGYTPLFSPGLISYCHLYLASKGRAGLRPCTSFQKTRAPRKRAI